MKERTLVAMGALLAVVLSAQVSGHSSAERISTGSPIQRFYIGLVSFERNTNTVVRDVLAKLTGQPVAERRGAVGPRHFISIQLPPRPARVPPLASEAR